MINFFEQNRRASDLNFKLACNLRSRTNKVFESQKVRKTNKKFDLLGCFQSFFKEELFINYMVICLLKIMVPYGKLIIVYQ